MASLAFILITLGLLGGFFAVTWHEAQRGMRLFATGRSRLDKKVARVSFIFEHVDLAAFVRDEVRRLSNRAGHDIVHLSLQAVRSAERLLTRLLRYLRARHEIKAVPPTKRAFVQTLSDFKGRLKATRPEISDIP